MSDPTDPIVAVGITRGATTLSLDHGSVAVADHPGGVRLTVRTGYSFSSVVLSPHQRDVLAAMLTPPSAAVTRAVEALSHFGVAATTPESTVRGLLATWVHSGTLSPAQVDQVVAAIRDGAR